MDEKNKLTLNGEEKKADLQKKKKKKPTTEDPNQKYETVVSFQNFF